MMTTRKMASKAKTAQATEPTRGQWGTCGPCELLSLKPTCVNHYEVNPIVSVEDLTERFHYALLARFGSPAADRWRAENRIDVTQARWVYFPHRGSWQCGPSMSGEWSKQAFGRDGACVSFDSPSWTVENVGAGRSEHHLLRQVEALLGSTGKLRVQLNDYHEGADTAKGVRVHVGTAGFRFVLTYGYGDDPYSSWDCDLAAGFAGEAFIATLDRACVEMERIAKWPEQAEWPEWAAAR